MVDHPIHSSPVCRASSLPGILMQPTKACCPFIMESTPTQRFPKLEMWQYTQRQEAELVSKACYTACHGRQQTTVDFEHVANDSKFVSDNQSDVLITDSSLPRLKERFLDRLSELFAKEKKRLLLCQFLQCMSMRIESSSTFSAMDHFRKKTVNTVVNYNYYCNDATLKISQVH